MDLEPLNLGMIAGGQGWGVWTGIQEGHDCGWGAGQQAASRCTQYTAGCSRPRAPLRHGHLVICSAVCACHCGALPSSACSCCAHVAPCPPPPPPHPTAYYYIAYTTIELFASSLTAKTKLKVRPLRWAAAALCQPARARPSVSVHVSSVSCRTCPVTACLP